MSSNDMTICHDIRLISEVLIYHCTRRVISDSFHYLSMLVFDKLRVRVSFHKQEYWSILCQLLACSGKSQLSNYANVNYLKILIWTWFMSYHVKTTLCHDIMTYDISWQL